MIALRPKAIRTHVLRCLGPKTRIIWGCWAIWSHRILFTRKGSGSRLKLLVCVCKTKRASFDRILNLHEDDLVAVEDF